MRDGDRPSRSASSRARRFDLSLRVWYRSANETQWHSGKTQCVSATGAVIRADGPVAPSRPVTVVIALPSVAGCLVGCGRVVRTVETFAQTALSTFAIRVSRYRIQSKSVLFRTLRRRI
jgi:hypothetical protein